MLSRGQRGLHLRASEIADIHADFCPSVSQTIKYFLFMTDTQKAMFFLTQPSAQHTLLNSIALALSVGQRSPGALKHESNEGTSTRYRRRQRFRKRLRFHTHPSMMLSGCMYLPRLGPLNLARSPNMFSSISGSASELLGSTTSSVRKLSGYSWIDWHRISSSSLSMFSAPVMVSLAGSGADPVLQELPASSKHFCAVPTSMDEQASHDRYFCAMKLSSRSLSTLNFASSSFLVKTPWMFALSSLPPVGGIHCRKWPEDFRTASTVEARLCKCSIRWSRAYVSS
mmetsp:Transcript_20461/g.54838  ORF Transcript_20461/g.54838 Transcript_20461/m.54838 type:complete len:284 (-) Transcript_20461:625-1476(-)